MCFDETSGPLDAASEAAAEGDDPGGFSPEEEAFIAASVEVIKAGAAVDEANAEFERTAKAITPLSDALGLEGREGLARTNELTHEAARRAGFGPDSDVVQHLDKAYQEVTQFLDVIDAAAAESLTAAANPEL